MNQVVESILEEIKKECDLENNVEFDANGDTLYCYANLMSVGLKVCYNDEIQKELSKDIAIGFLIWFFQSNYIRHISFEDVYYTCGSGDYKYTEEQLFNEYLNTLK